MTNSQAKQVDVTSEAYQRWLRAHRPPWEFFFVLTELEQEHLANLGDAHMEDYASVITMLLRQGEEYQTGKALLRGDTEAEESVAVRAALNIAQQVADAPQAGMAGMGASIAQGTTWDSTDKPQHTGDLFGKEPDAR